MKIPPAALVALALLAPAARGDPPADSGAAPALEPVEMTVGSPPMISDDTGTPGPNHWEVNFVFDAVLSTASNTYEVPLLDLNYGIGDRVQLKYEVPFVTERQFERQVNGSAERRSSRGFGDSTAGVKYRFYENKDEGFALALYPQVSFRTSGDSRATEDSGTTYILPLLLTKEFSAAALTANLGLKKPAASDRVDYFASIGVGARLTDRIAWMAEIAGEDLRHTGSTRYIFELGMRVALGPSSALVASCGRDVDVGGDRPHQTYLTFAYQRTFGE